MAKLATGRFPIAPQEYNATQFNQMMRQLQQILDIDIETKREAEDKEALDFFLSK